MDPRVIPEQFLGPQALIAVFRNAGGRPNADVVRTIAVLQSLVVNAEKVTVMVVHHTGKLVLPPLSLPFPFDGVRLGASASFFYRKPGLLKKSNIDCGMTHLTDEEIKSDVKKRVPEEAEQVEGIEFGCFTAEDFEKTILEDVETLRTDKLLRGVEVRGFALSTETGVLKEL